MSAFPCSTVTMVRWPRLALAYGWSAGVAFVVSLGACGYFYAVILKAPATESPGVTGPGALLIDLSLFGLFALHHSIMARSGAKRWIETLLPPALERATYVWLASLLLLAVGGGWVRQGGTAYVLSRPPALVLRGFQLGAVWLIARAAAHLNPLELAGIRAVQKAIAPPASVARPTAQDVELEVSGPYRMVRHPIYLGWIVLVWSVGVMTIDRLVFAMASTLYILLAIPWEERSLRAEHGEAYRRYTEAVRWRVLPWLF